MKISATTMLAILLVGAVSWPAPGRAQTPLPLCVSAPSGLLNCLYEAPIDTAPLGGRTPLLLIHGWQPDAVPASPQFLVWDNFLSYFNRTPALRSAYKPYYFGYYSNDISVFDLGGELRDVLDLKNASDPTFASRPLVIVAHSMGGLIARSYIAQHWQLQGAFQGHPGGDRILKLITLGTPHHGSPMANGPARDDKVGLAWAIALTLFDNSFYSAVGTRYNQLNRSNLYWDNYSSPLLDYGTHPSEQNSWLANELNSSTAWDNKVIAYAGVLDPALSVTSCTTAYCRGNAILGGALGLANDGIVPYTSALFYGANGQPRVTWRYFSGYDHTQMHDGKGDDLLFNRIAQDLERIFAPPTLFSPAGGLVFPAGTDSVGLQWSVIPNATRYDVEVWTGGCGSALFDEISTGSPAATLSGLASGTYSWQVRAADSAEASGFSGCFSFQIRAPHTLTVTAPPAGSPNPVASGGTANLSVTAVDSDSSHVLSYHWTASCPAFGASGSFNNSASRTPAWTAPANSTGSQANCALQVTVTDGFGLSQSASYLQGVSSTGHTLTITSGPYGSPNPTPSGGTAAVSASAADSLGHPVSYAWTASCPTLGSAGAFSNPNAASPTWTAPANSTGSQASCSLQVRVTDGFGLSQTASYSQGVASAGHTITVTSGPYGSPNPVQPGGVVAISTAASDSLGHTLSYRWTASCPGLASNGSFNDATAQNPLWTAPANTTGSQVICTIVVTASDGFGLSQTGPYPQAVYSTAHSIILNGPSGSPQPVDSGGTVSLTASATDSLGHALTYAWSASCPSLGSSGTFSNAAAQSPSWTAPRNLTGDRADCLITINVSDGHGLSQQASYFEHVSSEYHAIVFTAPPSANPNPVLSQQSATLSTAAIDTVGHPVSYAWSASCPALAANGSFSDPSAPNPTWMAPINQTGSLTNCTLQVTASDGFGLSSTAAYIESVGAEGVPTGDFTLKGIPSATGTTAGGTATIAVNLDVFQPPFLSDVALSCSGQPAGVTCSFNPNPIVIPGNGYASSTMTLTVASNVAPDSYQFTVSGTGGNLTRSFTVTLAVSASAPPYWSRIYGGGPQGDVARSVEPTADGGFVIAGYSGFGDRMTLKTDRTGAVQWEHTYGGVNGAAAKCVRQTQDGGYLILGSTNGAPSLLKLDGSGNPVWEKGYGGSTDSLDTVQQTRDGGYVAAGIINSAGAGQGDLWVLKLDSQGNITWQKTLGGAAPETLSLVGFADQTVQQTADGGYVVAVNTLSFGAGDEDAWVIKLDSAGAVQWQKTYGGKSADFVNSLQQTADGGYVLAGVTFSFGAGNEDAWVLKLDSAGAVQWQETLGETGTDEARSIRQASDGGYIVAGVTTSFTNGGYDAWVLKLDPSGGIQWQKAFGGGSTDGANAIRQTPDGGFIMAGFSQSFGTTWYQFWVVKMGPYGEVEPACQMSLETGAFPAPSTATVSTPSVTPGVSNVTPVTLSSSAATPGLLTSQVCAGCGSSTPTAPTVASNGPLCPGQTLALSASTVSGATYRWTGPNGFLSSLQNPTLTNVTEAASGNYSVTVTVGACTSPPSGTTAIVNPTPATPVIRAPSSAVAGATGLAAWVDPHGGSTFSWSIADGTITSGSGTSQVLFTAGTPGTLTLSVTETSATACVSPRASSALPVLPLQIFSNGFEQGDLSAWSHP